MMDVRSILIVSVKVEMNLEGKLFMQWLVWWCDMLMKP